MNRYDTAALLVELTCVFMTLAVTGTELEAPSLPRSPSETPAHSQSGELMMKV